MHIVSMHMQEALFLMHEVQKHVLRSVQVANILYLSSCTVYMYTFDVAE